MTWDFKLRLIDVGEAMFMVTSLIDGATSKLKLHQLVF